LSITFSNTPSVDLTTVTTTVIYLNKVEINYVLPSDSVANSSITFYNMDADTVSELVKDLFN